MNLLRPHIAFDPHETLLSYAARLSAFHTGLGGERLLRDIGVDPAAFFSGKPDAVVKFANATGNSKEAFERVAIAVHQRHVNFRGDRFSKGFLNPRTAKCCPECLSETPCRESWQHQLIWCFRPVHRCIRHGRALVPSGNKSGVDLRNAFTHESEKETPAISQTTPKFLSWLDEQLFSNDAPQTWMTGQTIEQVLAASEVLGAVLEHGHKVRPTKLSAGAQENATELGFSTYAEGPEAIAEALTRIRTSTSATAVQAGPLAMYGQLFDWLDRRCNVIDPGPIRDILREHIVKHSAVDSGAIVLGVEITKRKFHSLESLAQQMAIKRIRLSRLMQKLGYIPVGASDAESGVLVFDADEVITLIDDFGSAIALNDVPLYVGASKHQFDALYASGILTPLIPRNGPGSVRYVVFARRTLDALLSRLMEFPEVGTKSPKGLDTIAFACQRGGGTTSEVVGHILEGKLSAFRRSGKLGLAGVLVSPSAAIALKATGV